MLGSAATFLWYNLAAMHNPAPTTAIQNDQWNPADNRTVKVTSDAKGIDNVLVVDPIKGILRLNTVLQISVAASKPITKISTINNGFL